MRFGPACFALVTLLAHAGAARAQRTVISFLHTPPAAAPHGTPLRITGHFFGASDMERAVLVYRAGSADWRTADLRLEGADSYAAVVPGEHVRGEAFLYYVEAVDYFGDRRTVFATRYAPQSVPITGAASRPEPPPEPAPEPEPPPPRVELRVEPPPPPKPEPPPPRTDDRALADDLLMYGAEAPKPVPPAPVDTPGLRDGVLLTLDRATIRAFGLRTLADVMKLVPGFDTFRDVQGFWRVAVRGRRSDPEVRVLLDGVRLENPYDGRVNWELPVEWLERVEVRRGSGRAGDEAFAATVRLFSRTTPGFELTGSLGSFGTAEGRVRGAAERGGFVLSGDVGVTRRDGYRKPIVRDALTNDPDRIAGVTDDRRSAVDGGARVSRTFGEGGPELFVNVRAATEERGALVGFHDTVGPGSVLKWQKVAGDAGVHVDSGGWLFDLRLRGGRHATDRTFTLLEGERLEKPEFPTGIRARTELAQWVAGFETTLGRTLVEGNVLSVGASGELTRVEAFRYRANVVNVDPAPDDALVEPGFSFPQNDPTLSGRGVVAAWLEDDWRLAAPLRVTGGVRFDAVGNVGYAFNPRLLLAWAPTDALAARVGFSRAYRPPTFEELYTVVALSPRLGVEEIGGSPTLRPVSLATLEGSFEAAAPLGDARGTLEISGFWTEYDDPVDVVPEGSSLERANRDGVRVFGADAEGRYAFAAGRGLLFANVSWQRVVDLEQDRVAPLFALVTDVPQLRANFGASVPLGDWLSLSVLAQFGAERRQNARTPLEATRRFRIPGYGLLSATLRTAPLFDRFEVACSVSNATDVDWRDDVPRPDDRRMSGLLPREGVAGLLTVRASL